MEGSSGRGPRGSARRQVRRREMPPPGDFGQIKANISEICGPVAPLRSFFFLAFPCGLIRCVTPFGSAHLRIRCDLFWVRTERYPTMHLTSASDGSSIGRDVTLQCITC